MHHAAIDLLTQHLTATTPAGMSGLRYVPRRSPEAVLRHFVASTLANEPCILVGPAGVGKRTLVDSTLASIPKSHAVRLDLSVNSAPTLDTRLDRFKRDVIAALAVYDVPVGVIAQVVERHIPFQSSLDRLLGGASSSSGHLIGRYSPGTASTFESLTKHARPTERTDGNVLTAAAATAAFDLFSCSPSQRSRDARVLPFAVDLLTSAALHGKSGVRPKFIVQTEAPAGAADPRAQQLIDSLFMARKRSANMVPTVVVAGDPFFSVQFDDIFARAQEASPARFIELVGFDREELAASLVPSRLSRAQLDRLFDVVGGHPAFLAVAPIWEGCDDATLDAWIASFSAEHDARVAARLDDILARSSFADEGAKDDNAVLLHFLDAVARLRQVNFVFNYHGVWGEEALENSLIDVLLKAGVLYRQRSPTYVRPADRLVLRGLDTWARTKASSALSFGDKFKLKWMWHAHAGLGPLKHLQGVTTPETVPEWAPLPK